MTTSSQVVRRRQNARSVDVQLDQCFQHKMTTDYFSVKENYARGIKPWHGPRDHLLALTLALKALRVLVLGLVYVA